MPFVVGLDLGTTSVAAAAVAADGRVVAPPSRDHAAALPVAEGWRAEQDPERVEQTAVEVLRELIALLPEPPVALGLTGQMHGLLLADVRGLSVSPLYTWQDRRALQPGPDGRSLLEDLLERCPPESLDRTGCRLAAGYGGVTMYALRRRGEWPEAAAKALTIADWIAARWTAAPPVTDRGNAAAWGVYDLVNDAWSEPLLEASEIPPEILPTVTASGALLGELTPKIAQRTGLPVGLPVAAPTGDNQAAFLGAGPDFADSILVNVGTGGQICWPVETFVRSPGLDTRYLPDGRFFLVGAGLSGGDSYAWLVRSVGGWLRAFGCERSAEEVFETLKREAERARSGADPVCRPHFRGTRRDPMSRGSFSNLAVDNADLGGLARAVLRGVVDDLGSFYDAAGEPRPAPIRAVLAAGNAVRRNPLLARFFAERFEAPVFLPVEREEAARGAALLAGVSTGLWPNGRAARQEIRLQELPRPES